MKSTLRSDSICISAMPGPRTTSLLKLLSPALFAFAWAAVGADWAERFATPPADARILKIIHNWPDAPEAQDTLISHLRTQGFGGVVCNVSFNEYLESEAKWHAFTRAVSEARRGGMAMWLYDERGYPSGNAGGLTLRNHPEWEAHGLLVVDTETAAGAVSLTLPPGKLVLAKAFPVRDGVLDLSKSVDLAEQVHNGKLEWHAPIGRWRVLGFTKNRLFEGTHADANVHARIPYINLLQPEPTARFVELTYGGYARHLGSDLSRFFEATFTDEPSLMSLYFKPMPYRPLPWAPNLPVEFEKRRGYKLDGSLLPALVADAGPATQKTRHDFWLTVGELVSDNYFGQIQTRCRQLGVPSGGHLLAEENIASHVALYGDFFRCIRRLDAPSIDCLTSLPPEVPWFIARLLSSAAELEGRTLVMSETSDYSQRHRPDGDKRPVRAVSEEEVRGTCNRQIVAGVNTITSYYSFTDLSDEQLRRLNEWVGRCCAALRGGYQVADIAVVYPTESLWTKFTPSRHWTRECAAVLRIESLYQAAVDGLFTAQRDFTFLDSRALVEAKASSDALTHGQLRWRVVVLPGVDTLPLAAWEKLAKFVRQGGVVIALGALPANSENEFPSRRAQSLAKEIFGVSAASVISPVSRANKAGGAGVFLPHGSEGLLPLVLDGLLEPDAKVTGSKSPLRVTHRRIGGREVYFVINDSARTWEGQVSFAADGNGERWSPATGKCEERLSGGAAMLSLEPYGAVFFLFDNAKTRARAKTAGGALPNFSLRRLPKVQPTVPHGEFVRGEVLPDAAHSTGEAPCWRAKSVLTRSGVDTHLFAQFRYAEPIDLSDANGLAIDTWIPEGQNTPNRLLVILHEQDGGDFIAETARSLAGPGREQSFIPIGRFQLASWSKDFDGQLDLRRVQDVRVGWGGYLGTEGEEVQFSLALPQVGSVANSEPPKRGTADR